MKTFKEYYDKAFAEEQKWLSAQDTEWWKSKDSHRLEIKGNYDEGVEFLTVGEKNDSSLFYNHTNVKNSEWGILFDMLGQALVDWCRDNINYEKLWSFGFKIKRCSNTCDCSYYVNNYDFVNKTVVKEEDEDVIERFGGCQDFLRGIVDEFLSRHGKNIPNDWNYFSFGLDALRDSCIYGEWVCASDGYMNLGNHNEKTDKYEAYVECM